MGHECFCGAIRAHLDDRTVALLVDRLRDELTVAELRRTGLGERTPEDVRVYRPEHRRAVLALGFGALYLHEIVDEVYPLRARDPDEARLRSGAVRRMLGRLIETGEVERLGKGLYRLRYWGPPEKRIATMDDCRRILADPRVQPAGGLTAREIADRLDLPIGTVRCWLQRLKERGVRLLGGGRRGVAGGWRYRIARDEEVA